jgi:SAM-dependent methyltransferase
VTGFWHPVSAVYLNAPRVLASPAVLRLLMSGEGRAELVYAGDRMWPSVRHGQLLVVSPTAESTLTDGDVVLAVDGGIPDVMRLTASLGGAAVTADADPAPPRPVTPRDLLGRIDGARRRGAPIRSIARAWLDLFEAAAHGPDSVDDPAQTVRQKYDDQAVHYDRLDTQAIDPGLAARLVARVPRGARVMVAGSGAGREAFALELLGYDVAGVDFAPRMVEAAQAEAKRRGSSATFAVADLRSHNEPAGSLGAVVFTYDVYSFVPSLSDRAALLTRVSRWLAPGGAVFLSARRTQSGWGHAVLSLQWLRRAARLRPGAWGDSHTRWLDASGNLRRSFVHVFTDGRLDREAAAAGLRRVSWEGGHGLFVPREGAAEASSA